jgi:hypothetical protein
MLHRLPQGWLSAENGGDSKSEKDHSDRVTTAVFSPDESPVAPDSHDQTARAWDVDQTTELLRHENQMDAPVVTFVIDGMKIAVDGRLVPVLSHLSSSSTIPETSRLLLQSTNAELAAHDDWVIVSSFRSLSRTRDPQRKIYGHGQCFSLNHTDLLRRQLLERLEGYRDHSPSIRVEHSDCQNVLS